MVPAFSPPHGINTTVGTLLACKCCMTGNGPFQHCCRRYRSHDAVAGACAHIVGPVPTGSCQHLHHLDRGHQLQQIHQGVTTPVVIVSGMRCSCRRLQDILSERLLTVSSCSMQAAHGGSLPFPMNHWVPWRTRQAVAEHFKAHSAKQVWMELPL